MKHSSRIPLGRHTQSGLTLVEFLVSVLLALVVLGGVFVIFIATGASDRQQRALGRMTEDAQVAMVLISRELQMAGYMRIGTIGPNGTVAANSTRPVFGCDAGFVDSKAPYASATCPSPSPGRAQVRAHALEINHEVTVDTTLLGTNGNPTDCQGNEVTTGLVSNRFFVDANPSGESELYCATIGKVPQPLVPQVAQVRFAYGVAPHWAIGDASTWRPQRFISATDVEAQGLWSQVVAVRVCLLMRSTEPVLEAAAPPSTSDTAAR